MALIFLTFMSSIARSGLSDGAVADWEAEGGVCVYGGCTKPCQTTPHTITNGRMRNPFGLLTLNFMNQTRQYFRFFSFWLSPSHSCVTPTSLWSNLELIINCFKGKAELMSYTWSLVVNVSVVWKQKVSPKKIMMLSWWKKTGKYYIKIKIKIIQLYNLWCFYFPHMHTLFCEKWGHPIVDFYTVQTVCAIALHQPYT